MDKFRKVMLTSMKNGQFGVIAGIEGGKGSASRLESLGLRIGIKVLKKSALLGLGPVIVSAGGTEVAIGHGLASRIIIEVGA